MNRGGAKNAEEEKTILIKKSEMIFAVLRASAVKMFRFGGLGYGF